eukprot:scaffold385953_cov17-Prasinocladus_malaysianus.AAC.1
MEPHGRMEVFIRGWPALCYMTESQQQAIKDGTSLEETYAPLSFSFNEYSLYISVSWHQGRRDRHSCLLTLVDCKLDH